MSAVHALFEPTSPRRRALRDAGLAALFFLALLLVWARPWAGHRVLYTPPESDYALHAVPLRAWLFETGLPAWNPFWLGGVPVVETVQAAVWYPPTHLHRLLPPVAAANLLALGHLWLMAFSLYVLARRIGCGFWAGCVGGVAYGFSGFALLRWHGGHVNFLFAAPWVALCAAALSGLAHPRAWRMNTLGAAAAGGFLLVAGAPQIAFIGALILAVWATGESLRAGRREGRRAAQRVASGTLAAAAGAAALGAAQWAPAQDWLPRTIRGVARIRAGWFGDLALEARHLPGLLMPELFAPLYPSAPWGEWERLAPVGWIATALGVFALVLRAPRALQAAAIALCGVLLAFGTDLPGWDTLARLLPPLESFRRPGRFLFAFTFGVSTLAALGLAALQNASPAVRRRAARGLLAAAVGVGLVCLMLFTPTGPQGDHWEAWTKPDLRTLRQIGEAEPLVDLSDPSVAAWRAQRYGAMQGAFLKGVLLLGLAAGALRLGAEKRLRRLAPPLLVALAAAGVLHAGWGLRGAVPPEKRLWPEPLRETLAERVGPQDRTVVNRYEKDANRVLQLPVRALTGYEPAAPGAALRLLLLDQGYDPQRPPDFFTVARPTPWLDRWAVRWGWFSPGVPVPEGWIVRQRSAGGMLAENPGALPRARFCARAEKVASAEEALLRAHEDGAFATVFLLEEDFAGSSDFPAQAVPIVEETPERIVLQDDFPVDGYAVLADTATPGWRVSVDGEPRRLLRPDGVMRGVAVQAGRRHVVFEYAGTRTARLGRKVTLAAWAVFILGAALEALYNARRRGQSAPDVSRKPGP